MGAIWVLWRFVSLFCLSYSLAIRCFSDRQCRWFIICLLFRSVDSFQVLFFVSFQSDFHPLIWCIRLLFFFLVGAVPFFFLLRQTPFRIIIVMCVFVWCKSYCYVRTFEERKKHEVCFRIIEWIQMLVFGHNLAQCIMSTQCQIAYSILKIRGGKNRFLIGNIHFNGIFQWDGGIPVKELQITSKLFTILVRLCFIHIFIILYPNTIASKMGNSSVGRNQISH